MTLLNVKSFTLSQAAKVVGKSKSVLHHAVKSGKLPAKKSKNGVFEIEPNDLYQLFPQKKDADSDHLLLEQKILSLEQQLERERTLNGDLLKRLEDEKHERSKLLDLLSKVMSAP